MVLLRLVCVLPAICSLGCATERYYAKTLPPDLEAPLAVDPQMLDLSRLAVASASGEEIGRGDVLDIRISTGYGKPQSELVRVDDSGNADVPIIGLVPVAGLDMEMAESQIKRAGVNRQFYRFAPHVTVVRHRQQKNHVLVIGAVNDPNRYEFPRRNCGLLSVITAAGGLAENAGFEVEIRYPGGVDSRVRHAASVAGGIPGDLSIVGHSQQETPAAGPRSVVINLVSATESDKQGYYVEDGAIVVVKKREPMQVTVMGLVKTPGTYDFPVTQEVRVSHAIAQAEGISSILADKILVKRRLPHLDGPKVIQLSLSAVKKGEMSNLRLAPGDIVTVEQTPATVFMAMLQIIRVGLNVGGAIF